MKSWQELLKAAIERSSIAKVAGELGYSRTTISLVNAGKYPGDTRHVERRIYELYSRIDCPFTGNEISSQQCAERACGGAPTSNPRALKHWSFCQQCPKRPESKEEEQ
ncbi:hypothetical protein [Pseudogulbenkiania sp. MAI-1]|uniref:hypothetical protein n=1 Tax=Pseudogulbenkiania sp. MAI-1 TaxID=990370 RepID=UPI0004A4FBDE|nr:hypothetical protein [Pseudogulbenkiania sp. MAI-1]